MLAPFALLVGEARSDMARLCDWESRIVYLERMSGQAGIAGCPPASIVRWRAEIDSIMELIFDRRDSSVETVSEPSCKGALLILVLGVLGVMGFVADMTRQSVEGRSG